MRRRWFRRLWECKEKTLSELVGAMENWTDEDTGGVDKNDKKLAKDLCYRLREVEIDVEDLDIYRNWAEIVGRYSFRIGHKQHNSIAFYRWKSNSLGETAVKNA